MTSSRSSNEKSVSIIAHSVKQNSIRKPLILIQSVDGNDRVKKRHRGAIMRLFEGDNYIEASTKKEETKKRVLIGKLARLRDIKQISFN